MMDVEVNFNDDETILIQFPLFAGQADLLLVKDERDVRNSERFYLDVLDSLWVKAHFWDIAVHGNPDTSFLNNFPAVIWYTGYDQDSTISETNQLALMHYLDQGGRLFMTGQNISDETSGSVLMNNYLHASHSANTGGLSVKGYDGDPVGDGLAFLLNENIDMANQYSQSRLIPLNGGIECFKYGNTSAVAGIRFENDDFKTLFLGFGFESLDLSTRYALMLRILEYFDLVTGVSEAPGTGVELYGLSLAPNPARENVTVQYTIEMPQEIEITIFDLAGRMISREMRMHDVPGRKYVTLLLDKENEGVYLVRVKGLKGMATAKLVIVR
jgi:hypothetical protein